eukprot:1385857-Amorphochlora_amoeboformis.AAC.2
MPTQNTPRVQNSLQLNIRWELTFTYNVLLVMHLIYLSSVCVGSCLWIIPFGQEYGVGEGVGAGVGEGVVEVGLTMSMSRPHDLVERDSKLLVGILREVKVLAFSGGPNGKAHERKEGQLQRHRHRGSIGCVRPVGSVNCACQRWYFRPYSKGVGIR